jgi:hypothetical protein
MRVAEAIVAMDSAINVHASVFRRFDTVGFQWRGAPRTQAVH